MIEKIVRIRSVSRFRNYSAIDDVTFRKLTLIYADNGRGKTTLCAILRSLQNGQSEYISERITLAADAPVFVHMRINGADYRFDGNGWTNIYPDMIIFDPVFINENVYSGEYVEHEHKKNLYRIIVGERGVQLSKQIEELDKNIRDCNADIRIKRDRASMHLPRGGMLEEYLQWKPFEDIDNRIRQKTEEYSNRQRAVAKSNEIRARDAFKRIKLPEIPSDFYDILVKQLEDVVLDAEAKMNRQIAQHQMDRQGESWLFQGLGYVNIDRCPFCGQNIQSNELIAAYRSHFGEAYKSLKQEIARLSDRISYAIGESVLSVLQKDISDNLILSEFWMQFIEVQIPDISITNIQEKLTALREICLALAKKKQDNPLEKIIIDEAFSTALREIETLQQVVDRYNVAVDNANVLVNNKKLASEDEGDLNNLSKELEELLSSKKRFEPEVEKSCKSYQDAVALKLKLEHDKELTRQLLDQYCEDILRNYETAINQYLDQFGTGFRITNTRHLYTGGTPSSQYQIQINNIAVDLGDSRTLPGTPCFKTTLSSGDRSALALAFFLAVLKQDPDINRKVIVFDDPFTSQDRFRRTCTQQLIQLLSESANQVIVLSHDPYFLKLLWDENYSTAANVKPLQMSKTGDTTIIGQWDPVAETQSAYQKNCSTLQNYYRERKGDPRLIATTIRPFLEGMLRSRFPGHFQANEWLGDFLEKIRCADSNSGLEHAKADLPELEAINGYSRKYHHDQNENAGSELINEDELYAFVRRTLRLVGND